MKTRLMLLQKGYHPNLHCALASDSGSYSLDTHSINSTCYYWLAPRNLHNNVLFIRHKYCHCFRAKIAFFMSLLLFCSRSSHLIKYFLLFLFPKFCLKSFFLNWRNNLKFWLYYFFCNRRYSLLSSQLAPTVNLEALPFIYSVCCYG